MTVHRCRHGAVVSSSEAEVSRLWPWHPVQVTRTWTTCVEMAGLSHSVRPGCVDGFLLLLEPLWSLTSSIRDGLGFLKSAMVPSQPYLVLSKSSRPIKHASKPTDRRSRAGMLNDARWPFLRRGASRRAWPHRPPHPDLGAEYSTLQ